LTSLACATLNLFPYLWLNITSRASKMIDEHAYIDVIAYEI